MGCMYYRRGGGWDEPPWEECRKEHDFEDCQCSKSWFCLSCGSRESWNSSAVCPAVCPECGQVGEMVMDRHNCGEDCPDYTPDEFDATFMEEQDEY